MLPVCQELSSLSHFHAFDAVEDGDEVLVGQLAAGGGDGGGEVPLVLLWAAERHKRSEWENPTEGKGGNDGESQTENIYELWPFRKKPVKQRILMNVEKIHTT